jgi:hypothetical protein
VLNSYRVPGLENGVLRGPLVSLADQRRGHPNTGTRALMLAVFEDGVRCYLTASGRTRSEAEEWVCSAQRRSPFSFVVVCEALGLQPSAVRTALRRFRARSMTIEGPLGRSRPYSRRRRSSAAGSRPPSNQPVELDVAAAWSAASTDSHD